MTNAAAIGYAILAGQQLGMTKDELRSLESVMNAKMDQLTEEEAEEAYRKN
ncbi:hypothetical protein [Paenibacillus validus]|uniref:hypothetical protein n=1 Tax=Paenibacillus validus TaxID=44253 RepID=UPI003D2C7795